jgi:hypothetical protein
MCTVSSFQKDIILRNSLVFEGEQQDQYVLFERLLEF